MSPRANKHPSQCRGNRSVDNSKHKLKEWTTESITFSSYNTIPHHMHPHLTSHVAWYVLVRTEGKNKQNIIIVLCVI